MPASLAAYGWEAEAFASLSWNRSRAVTVAAIAPSNCANTNQGTPLGLIPAKVLVNARASETAGLANEVEAVNQYAATM